MLQAIRDARLEFHHRQDANTTGSFRMWFAQNNELRIASDVLSYLKHTFRADE